MTQLQMPKVDNQALEKRELYVSELQKILIKKKTSYHIVMKSNLMKPML